MHPPLRLRRRHHLVVVRLVASTSRRSRCRPSPCARLTRAPRRVVTPATTTAAPPPPAAPRRPCAFPPAHPACAGGGAPGGSHLHPLIAPPVTGPTLPRRPATLTPPSFTPAPL